MVPSAHSYSPRVFPSWDNSIIPVKRTVRSNPGHQCDADSPDQALSTRVPTKVARGPLSNEQLQIDRWYTDKQYKWGFSPPITHVKKNFSTHHQCKETLYILLVQRTQKFSHIVSFLAIIIHFHIYYQYIEQGSVKKRSYIFFSRGFPETSKLFLGPLHVRKDVPDPKNVSISKPLEISAVTDTLFGISGPIPYLYGSLLPSSSDCRVLLQTPT